MEDNVVYEVKENGEKVMATNHMLVERAVNAVKAFGNTPATPDEARRMLGIPAFDGGRVRAALGIDYLHFLAPAAAGADAPAAALFSTHFRQTGENPRIE